MRQARKNRIVYRVLAERGLILVEDGRASKWNLLMLFDDLLPEMQLRQNANPCRRGMLDVVLADFQTTFVELTFELRLDFRIINAQAIRLGEKRCVLIYGGLALHPDLGEDALTFTVLHEVGHHLAEGSRSPYYKALACECASDVWAVTQGAALLQQRSGRRLNLLVAMDQLSRIIGLGNSSCAGYTDQGSSVRCWNERWLLRKLVLLELEPAIVSGLCRMELD